MTVCLADIRGTTACARKLGVCAKLVLLGTEEVTGKTVMGTVKVKKR